MWPCRWMGKCGSMGSRNGVGAGGPGRMPPGDLGGVWGCRVRSPTRALALRLSACSAQDDRGAELRGRADLLFGEEVVEGFYGGEFVVFDVEDGVELGDLDDVVNFLGEAEEF